MVEAIILAAGLSSRMGKENKLLLPFNGKAILTHTIETLSAAQIDKIIVVTGYEQDKITSLLRGMEVEIVHNENYEQGQLTSIQKGISQLSTDCEAFLVCLSDMPLLTAQDYNNLIQTYELVTTSRPIVVPHNGERAGNPKLFSIGYRAEIQSLSPLRHQGAKKILKRHPYNIVYYPAEKTAFFTDVDTPEAYQRLIKNH